MAEKPMIKGPDIYIGGKPRAKSAKKKPSWEAKELGEINKYWKREPISREGKRQAAVHRTSAKTQYRRSGSKT
jgi:hypothetical protein